MKHEDCHEARWQTALFVTVAAATLACSSQSSPVADDAERPDVVLRFWDMSASTPPADAVSPPLILDGSLTDSLPVDGDVDALQVSCDVDRGAVSMTEVGSGIPVADAQTVRIGSPYGLNDTWAVEHPDWLQEPCYNDWLWSFSRADGLAPGWLGERFNPFDGSLGLDDPSTPSAAAIFLEYGDVDVILLRRDGLGLVPPQTRSLRVVVVD